MPKDIYASLKQGLVGCWIPSISGSGLTLPDLSQRGNHGSLVGMDASDWVSSGSGRALDFDGVDDSASVGRPPVIDNTINNFTITTWVKPTGSFVNFRNIFGKGDAMQFGIIVTSTGDWRAQFATSTDLNGGQLSLDTWTFVAYKLQAGVATTYQNGLALNSGSRTTAVKAFSFEIGRDVFNNRNFSGLIDDFRFYSRPLTEPEIKLLASKRGIGLEPRKPDITYYQFPSGSKRRRLLTGMP